ncbi:MAG: hypothetical protein ACLQU3_13735 [Limisphaerales bacterium]
MTTITFKQTEFVIQHAPDQPPTTLPPLPDTSSWPDPKPVPNPDRPAQESKSIITAKSPLPTQPANADYLITEFHDNSEPWKIDLAELFIKLGQKVIETEQCDHWLTMTQVSALCRRYRLNWKKQTTQAKHLERFGREYLDRHTDIMGGGVKVEYRTEWNEKRTRELMFLKFRRLYPDGSCN